MVYRPQVRPNKLPWLGDRASWERAHKIKITDLETFRVEYGDKFYASCFVIDAEVRIGDVNGMQALQVPHQLIGVAEVHGGNVETTPKFRQCGLLGLSLETLRELPYNAGPSIMQNSYLATDDAGQPLANALRAFAIKVPSGTDDRGSLRGDGFIWLQASSDALATLREKYKSPLWYNGLMSRPGLMKSDIPGDRQNGFWAFWSPMYYIGGDVLQIDNVGIADTGTSQALIHPDACKALYGKIDAQYCKYENDKWYLAKGMPLDKIPAFGIAVGKCPIWIAPDDIYDHANAELVDGDWVEGTFQARQDDEDLLGAPFLKNYVAVCLRRSPQTAPEQY